MADAQIHCNVINNTVFVLRNVFLTDFLGEDVLHIRSLLIKITSIWKFASVAVWILLHPNSNRKLVL